jgi:signal transduction histidine kinase
MSNAATRPWRVGIVAALTAATVSFHYGVLIPAAHGTVLHAIHGRLCYVPIILAAVWFGVRGGLLTALAITALTIPYPRLRGITDHHTLVGEYTEMVFYVAIGLMTGVLIERQWRERERNTALERELARRERLSSLGQMAAGLAGLAHEIKNPLGSIQGAAEILGDDAPPGSKQRELFDVLRKESRRLGAVVDDFLGFARPRPPQLAPLDIARAVERASSQIALDASARHIEIARDVAPGLPPIAADAEQIHQVLLNLLLNAVSASADGNRVRVDARAGSRDGHRTVVLSIRDHGVGIAPEVLQRVFDPFFTTKEHGSGLGLSISHTIVRDHGGSIDIDSTPGVGTTVTVVLPAQGGGHAG